MYVCRAFIVHISMVHVSKEIFVAVNESESFTQLIKYYYYY